MAVTCEEMYFFIFASCELLNSMHLLCSHTSFTVATNVAINMHSEDVVLLSMSVQVVIMVIVSLFILVFEVVLGASTTKLNPN